MKPLEQALSEYLLGLTRGDWTKGYNRACLALWEQRYGKTVADRVRKILTEKWRK